MNHSCLARGKWIFIVSGPTYVRTERLNPRAIPIKSFRRIAEKEDMAQNDNPNKNRARQLSAEILEEALENAFDSVWIVSLPDFKLEYANFKVTERLLGYPAESFFRDPSFWYSLVVSEDREIATAANDRCLRTGSAEAVYRMIRKDGQRIWVQARLKAIKNEQGQTVRVVGNTTDITESRETQEKLLNSMKMSTLGEVASGIAHEINTPLAVISSRVGQLQDALDAGQIDPAQLASGLAQIELTTQRISRIIKGLSAYTKANGSDPMQLADLSRVVEDTLGFCKEKFRRRGVELRLTVSNVPACECRPSEISQVLLSLLANAYDAIESQPEKWIAIEVASGNRGAQVAVSNSGASIPEPVRLRMMEPFFSTKETGKRTGLGLHVSRKIVEAHNGRLYLDPDSRHTRFVVELPYKIS